MREQRTLYRRRSATAEPQPGATRTGIQISWSEEAVDNIEIQNRPIEITPQVCCINLKLDCCQEQSARSKSNNPSSIASSSTPGEAGNLNRQPCREHQGRPLVILAVLLLLIPWISRGQQPSNASPRPPTAETIVLPKSVPDPIEPFNRVMWGFNKGLMTDVIKPTSKVYRFVVVKPVRTGIGNFGKNLTYPGRLINNLLQGKWAGARDETYRFACNTTVGVGRVLRRGNPMED